MLLVNLCITTMDCIIEWIGLSLFAPIIYAIMQKDNLWCTMIDKKGRNICHALLICRCMHLKFDLLSKSSYDINAY